MIWIPNSLSTLFKAMPINIDDSLDLLNWKREERMIIWMAMRQTKLGSLNDLVNDLENAARDELAGLGEVIE